ncbi:MAG: hypothetical protein Q4G40_05295, partial [Brachybacterium sp.]|nr:hypothetical protein [Brachybacterium sp.]
MRRTVQVTGTAPPDLVRRRYRQTARWPEWAPQIRAVEPADALIYPGMTGVVHGPLGLRVFFTILTVEGDGETWSWQVSALGVR